MGAVVAERALGPPNRFGGASGRDIAFDGLDHRIDGNGLGAGLDGPLFGSLDRGDRSRTRSPMEVGAGRHGDARNQDQDCEESAAYGDHRG